MESSTAAPGGGLITGAAAVVLAGGRSVRMGRDKRTLEIEGEALLLRSIRLMREVFSEVFVSGDSIPAEAAAAADGVVADIVPGRGPLVGILSCLRTLDRDALFFVACDAPFPSPELVRHMYSRLADAPAEVLAVVAASERGPEPLFAFYRADAAGIVSRVLDESDGRVRALFDAMKVEVVGPEQWSAIPGAPQSFINVNRPEDFERIASGRLV